MTAYNLWDGILCEVKFILLTILFLFIYLLQCWGLNSGPYPCAGTLPLEPLSQPYFVLGILEIGSLELFAQAAFELRFS
jgi:hypothetical protein